MKKEINSLLNTKVYVVIYFAIGRAKCKLFILEEYAKSKIDTKPLGIYSDLFNYVPDAFT